MAYQPYQPYQPYFNGYQGMQTPAYNQPAQERLAQLQQYQQQLAPAPQPQPINQGINWVQGEAGAKAWLIAPNTTVILMDSDSQRFFIKSCDAAGIPSMRVFEYTEVSADAPTTPTVTAESMKDDFCTKAEYQALMKKITKLEKKLALAYREEDEDEPTI